MMRINIGSVRDGNTGYSEPGFPSPENSSESK
jgi:hypothetical protein